MPEARKEGAAPPEPDRPQPLTPDVIPDPPKLPRSIDDNSPLTDEEAADYAACERALNHYAQASWMYGKALHALRDARLYREEYGTWIEFLDQRCGGISESQAHRLIEEWPLAAAITDELGQPPTQSHVTKLMPVVKAYEISSGVLLYRLLREQYGRKLTADIVRAATKEVLTRAGRKAELEEVETAAAEIAAQPLPGKKEDSKDEKEAEEQPKVKALADAYAAQRAIWSALSEDTIRQALQEDAARTIRLIASIEEMARRSQKRAKKLGEHAVIWAPVGKLTPPGTEAQ